MEIQEWKNLSPDRQQYYLRRSEEDIQASIAAVSPIIEDVRMHGDRALREYTRRFDGVDTAAMPTQVGREEFHEAESSLKPEVKAALNYAIENVKTYHSFTHDNFGHDSSPRGDFLEVRPGIHVGKQYSPIDSVGIYVPRGRGSFPSMLYMLAVPAVLAGVPHIAIATPPQPDGRVDAACLYAARVCGIDRVYRMGGSQAIAALAFGTETVSAVKKIVGPGSSYVNAAKRLLSDIIDPGLPAGPSESIIVADGQADPWLVTLDLFTEAEHGSDSSSILITDSLELAGAVKDEAEQYLEEIPEPRRSFVRDVFSNYGAIFLMDSIAESLELVNAFAPEHLQIQTSNPREHLRAVRNAGEILLGVPFTVANYAAGANAVLPTGGRAGTWSAVSVQDFMKFSSVVEIDDAGYGELERHCRVLANYEGFFTHHEALARRKQRGFPGHKAKQ